MAAGERKLLEGLRGIGEPAARLGIELMDPLAAGVDLPGRGLGTERAFLEGLERLRQQQPVVGLRGGILGIVWARPALLGGAAEGEPARRRVAPFGDRSQERHGACLLEHAEVFDDGKILEDPLVGIGGGGTTDDEPEHEGPEDTPRRPPPRPAPGSPRRLQVGGRPPSRGNRRHLDRRRGEAHRGGGGSQAIQEDADVVERIAGIGGIAAGRGRWRGVSSPWGRAAHDAPPPASPAAGDRIPSR